MKQTIRTFAAFALLGITLAGCQKEEQLPMQQNSQTETVSIVYEVSYSINGTYHHQRVNGEQNLRDLMQQLMALGNNGYSIHIRNASVTSEVFHTKEKVTFTTRNEEEAINWSIKMISNGYNVEITEQDGVFVCVAVK